MAKSEGGCEQTHHNATVTIAFSQCAEHGHPRIEGVLVDPDGITPEPVIRGLISVTEQLIAARFATTEGPLRDLLTADYDGEPMDNTEQHRLASMIANQLLMMTVRERSYAQAAEFHRTGP